MEPNYTLPFILFGVNVCDFKFSTFFFYIIFLIKLDLSKKRLALRERDLQIGMTVLHCLAYKVLRSNLAKPVQAFALEEELL